MRAFLAIGVEDELRGSMRSLQAEWKRDLASADSEAVRIAWVEPARLHLTLRFLGEVAEATAAALREALERAVPNREPVRVPVDTLGAFPNASAPRVLWVGPAPAWRESDDARRLASLQRTLEACCRAVGCPPDDTPWTPHVTLARVRAGSRRVGQQLAASGALERPRALGEMRVGPIALMKSEALATGPAYTTLWTVA